MRGELKYTADSAEWRWAAMRMRMRMELELLSESVLEKLLQDALHFMIHADSISGTSMPGKCECAANA